MKMKTMDGNTATAYVSYAFSEIAVIYPITPSSPMAETADIWATEGKKNLFDQVPIVRQMQSESGVAGAVHGALTCGALTTTYTCSQGLLLMLPDMYKIAGELLPTVFHVSARALSAQALNIFGDHQDVMASRQSGFAILCSSSVQECMDLALVAHLSTLNSNVPFLHFFDGFRTSHEFQKIQTIEYDEMKTLVNEQAVRNFKRQKLDPAHPVQRGTAQNGDVYFQNRERANPYYLQTPNIVRKAMDDVFALTGRKYSLFDYYGSPDAERVLVMMGSGTQTAEETVDKMNADGEKVGLIKVRLYRPFCKESFLSVLPSTCKKIAVLDRTKEHGALGEPLYLDVCATLFHAKKTNIEIFGGRYGLGGKEFTPTDCYATFKNLTQAQPKNNFTVGILDDITDSSLNLLEKYRLQNDRQINCKFFGLGSDGTVGANKNSVKIIGDYTNLYAQAYFYYDSKKSGGVTISHLRFSPDPIRSAYLIDEPNFVACHNHSYLERYQILDGIKENGTFLLNCPWTTIEDLEKHLPQRVKRQIAQNNLNFYVINATEIANEVGLRGRTSTIMQSAFFLLHPSVMPYDKAKDVLKKQLKETFFKKGEKVIEQNLNAVERTEHALKKIEYPNAWAKQEFQITQKETTGYFENFIQPILELQGDSLPVSAFSADGSVPTQTTRYERHGIAYLLPKWIKENCIQCNQCSYVCPHACIRPFLFDKDLETPNGFETVPALGVQNTKFKIQVVFDQCMGCGVCANVCPAKNKALVMTEKSELLPLEKENWNFATNAPQIESKTFKRNTIKGSQFYPPLFEYSYACAGCGETAYIKILTQLFGERLTIANATGCSSIYGGSAPTCPYATNKDGQGPAWASSLFEDNAEFGYGMRLAYNLESQAQENKKSVWLVGGDGWAYDIGFGGLDHVLASGENVKALVLNSEVYSNTGGQSSKATPLGAVTRFASAGKGLKRKNLALMAISYGYVYVAQVALGGNMQQYLTALTEAESYDGPALIIAYTPCIAHGFNMSNSVQEERLAVECGYWHLFRYDPTKKLKGEKPFILDSKEPSGNFKEFLIRENRFALLKQTSPERAEELFSKAEQDAKELYAFYKNLSEIL
ncbi:MAG: pyruvate:ferredoxin (flavodoxin) oxidoreductase [Clostridiales bacterium]|nr:pyruvate:ferredoxin (flavodoxin) oxidoreductase [Clostridiales bacterium]